MFYISRHSNIIEITSKNTMQQLVGCMVLHDPSLQMPVSFA